MVQCCFDNGTHTGYILMRPNLSESWLATLWFFGFVALVPLLIAIVFALLGFWPVLPFAGAEVLVLGWAVHSVRKRASIQEVIRFDEDSVAFERGIDEAEYAWVRNRVWIRAYYDRSKIYGHPHVLSLGYQNERCEFGAFLTNEEREAVVSELSNQIRVLRK